jgi:uncharacterized protein Yka (UPF0111/DUF47 family)
MSEDKPDIFAGKHTARDIDDRIDAEMNEVSKYAIQTDERLLELESEVKYLLGENTRMIEQLSNHYDILQELGVIKDNTEDLIDRVESLELGEDDSSDNLSNAVAEIQDEIIKMTDGKTWFVNGVRQ